MGYQSEINEVVADFHAKTISDKQAIVKLNCIANNYTAIQLDFMVELDIEQACGLAIDEIEQKSKTKRIDVKR